MPGTDVELTDVELADVVQDRAQPPDAEDAEPVCRICHDDLSSSPGHPVTLKCACKGALRAAHAQCALRWFRSRGDAGNRVGRVLVPVAGYQHAAAIVEAYGE